MVKARQVALVAIPIGIVAVAAFAVNEFVIKPGKENGNGGGPDPSCAVCTGNVDKPCVKIDSVNETDRISNFIQLTGVYRNLTCDSLPITIVLQVKNLNTNQIEKLQFRTITLGAKLAGGFEWNLIFLENGPKKAEFFVWQSETNPIPFSKPASLNFTV